MQKTRKLKDIKIDKKLRRLALTSKDPDELAKLAKTTDDWVVRLNVAKNKHTSQKTLKELSKDPVWEVTAWIPDNPNCSEAVYWEIADSDDADILHYLVISELTPVKIIEYVLKNNPAADLAVKLSALKTGRLNLETLKKYIKDINPEVRKAAEIQYNSKSAAKIA